MTDWLTRQLARDFDTDAEAIEREAEAFNLPDPSECDIVRTR